MTETIKLDKRPKVFKGLMIALPVSILIWIVVGVLLYRFGCIEWLWDKFKILFL